MLTREVKGLLLLAAAVAMAFVGFMLVATDGHFVAQVVDLYLVCQYARALAEGHPFHYNAGEPASTGATSLLHTAILGAADAAGFRGEGLIAFAILLGAALYVATVLLARRLASRLAGPREGVLAGALVALGGPVVWGFLYGSDLGLFMALSLLVFDRLVAEWDAPRLATTLVACGLLALARPEGLPIAVLVAAGWSLGPGRRARAGDRVRAWIPAAVGVGVLGLYRLVSGLWLGTSVADKSLFANYGLADGLALVSEYVVDVVRGLLLGFYPSQVPVGFARGWSALAFPPLGLLLVLVALARPRDGRAAPVRLWGAIVGIVIVLVAPSMFMGVHFNRYVSWAFPGLLVLVAVGLGTTTRLLARDDAGADRSLFAAGAGLLLALGLLSTVRFAALYGDMAGQTYARDVKAAEWIARNLPHGVAIANLATSVEYLTGHRNVNLHGVTSPAFFGNRTAEREAGVFEALGRLAVGERPPYLLTTVSTQDGNAAMRELADGEPLYRSLSLGDEILLYRARYDAVGRGGRIVLPESLKAVEGLQETDRLNVCDSRDEAAHDYDVRSHLAGVRLYGAARIESYRGPEPEKLVDAGRAVLGSESFDVATHAGRDLVAVMRTAPAMSASVLRAAGNTSVTLQFPEAGFVVAAGGQPAGRVTFHPRAGWDEVVFRVPGRLLRDGKTRLEMSGRYASFQYWFYQ